MKFIDHSGERFGRWTVTQRDLSRSQQRTYWLCKCECGREVSVDGVTLRRGKSLSCGCLRTEQLTAWNQQMLRGVPSPRRQPFGMAMAKYVFQQYKSNARERGFAWALSFEEFLQLTSGDCVYCGAAPTRSRTRPPLPNGTPHTYGWFTYNGIDRRDNAKGYIAGNVASCCSTCNYMKFKMTVAEFVEHCGKIVSHTRQAVISAVA